MHDDSDWHDQIEKYVGIHDCQGHDGHKSDRQEPLQSPDLAVIVMVGDSAPEDSWSRAEALNIFQEAERFHLNRGNWNLIFKLMSNENPKQLEMAERIVTPDNYEQQRIESST